MALTKKAIVEIRQAANGYIVMPAADMSRGTMTSDDDRYVFQTFAELVAWMSEHFTHRAAGVATDGA